MRRRSACSREAQALVDCSPLQSRARGEAGVREARAPRRGGAREGVSAGGPGGVRLGGLRLTSQQ